MTTSWDLLRNLKSTSICNPNSYMKIVSLYVTNLYFNYMGWLCVFKFRIARPRNFTNED